MTNKTSVADGMGTSAGAWHGCHFSVKERERGRGRLKEFIQLHIKHMGGSSERRKEFEHAS